MLSIIISTLAKYITACNITTLLLYYWVKMSLESVWEAFSTVDIDVLKLHPIFAVFRDSRGGQERNPRE